LNVLCIHQVFPHATFCFPRIEMLAQRNLFLVS
jgi:hypothetical protein